MKPLHVLPIKAGSMEMLIGRLHEEAPQADIVEIWLDSIKDLRLAELFFEKAELNIPFLMVNKARFEGGDFMGTPRERIQFLKEALERGAEYVDVAFRTHEKELKILIEAKEKSSRNQKSHLILSYHNFKITPSLKKLKEIVKQSIRKGADIVKLATFVRQPEENIILFEATAWARAKGIPIITMGMGQHGKMSRVVCPLLGSAMVYAPLKHGEKTAPGQMTREEIQDIWETLVE